MEHGQLSSHHTPEVINSSMLSRQQRLMIPHRGLGSLEPSSINAGMLSGMILYKSYTGKYHYCEFMSATLLSWAEVPFCSILPHNLAPVIFPLSHLWCPLNLEPKEF